MYTYSAYGLGVHSDLCLKELSACESPPDIIVRLSDQVCQPGSIAEQENVICGDKCEVSFAFPDVGRFLARGGREITIEPLQGVTEDMLVLCLLGAIFPLVLQQRGLSVFHGSVVAMNGDGVAFVGGKGSGKTTLAAALQVRGHRFLSDDNIVFDQNVEPLLALAGFPVCRAWPDTIQALGEQPEQHRKLAEEYDKRAREIRHGFSTDPVRLRWLFLLAVNESESPRMTPLSSQEALVGLMPHWKWVPTRGIPWLDTIGRDSHLKDCCRMVRETRIFRLDRPLSLDLLPTTVSIIEDAVGA